MFLCLFYFFVPGRVCVPIDPNRCEEFDPTAVPTLSNVNMYLASSFLLLCIYVFLVGDSVIFSRTFYIMHIQPCKMANLI